MTKPGNPGWTMAAAIPLAGLLTACAGTPPRAAMARADLAVQQAINQGGPEHAPLEVDRARDKLTSARAAADDGEYTRARRLAEQATVDAELAQAKAEAARTRTGAERVRESMGVTP